jgi:hypothetical protein
MKRRVIQTFLVIAISLLFSIDSTYLHYYTLASADFISHDSKFETLDQEYLLAANQSELKLSILAGFFNGFLLATHFFRQSPHFFSQVLSLDQKNLVLRC